MRNKYSKEFDEFVFKNCNKFTFDNLRKKCEKKFNMNIEPNAFRKYLYRRKVHCIDYNENLAIGGRRLTKPIGYEWVRDDGLILIKVAEPSVWIYKQRYIYEKHYGKLKKGEMVIFLDGDRNNYDIDNLKAVTTREYLFARNKGLLSDDKDITRTSMLLGKMYYKTKEIGNEK